MGLGKRVFVFLFGALAVLDVIGAGVSMGAGDNAQTEVAVFAAASTANAVTEIGELYAARGLGRVVASFAASSTLAKQIQGGAPADVCLLANPNWMDFLETKNLIAAQTRFNLLGNRIVLIVPMDSPLKRIDLVAGFAAADLLGKDGRLAMGDPDHVPAGMYGKKALENLGCWDSVRNRLAPAKDVRAAMVLVERGEVPLGLVYATDAAISRKVRVVGTFAADSHPPVVYPVAAVAGGRPAEAERFLDFLKSPQARAVFEKYGFDVP